MNQLSQLLYLGNVAGNIGGFFVFFGILLLVFIIVMFISSFVCFDAMQYSGTDKVGTLKTAKSTRRWACAALPLVFILWLLAALCPSQDTVYAIAASEMGGKVLSSTTGNLAEQALNSWLKKQIAPTATTPASN